METENRRNAVKASVRKILDQWRDDMNRAVLTDNQRNLVRRAAVISAWLEEQELGWANSGRPLPQHYFRAVSVLNQITERLQRERTYGGLAA